MRQFINKLLGRVASTGSATGNAEKETATLEMPDSKEGMSIVEQIHNEAFSAQELLLKEAHRILNQEMPANEEKCARMDKLAQLGFKNADQVVEYHGVIQKKKDYAQIQKLVEYYEQEYPLNRFINEGTVKRICKNYDLYLVEAHRYEAEIPDKNQIEIVNFRVKGKDARWPSEMWEDGARVERLHNKNTGKDNTNERIEGKHLLIVAPEHKINTEGLIKRGRKLVNEDPIVLQPVLGGYLIVTAWGLEAADEKVVNKVSN